VRGRLLPPPAPERAPVAVLETEVSGRLLKARVSLAPDGSFEAVHAVALPPARRGWRVARHALTWAGQTARACSVVMTPPAAGPAADVRPVSGPGLVPRHPAVFCHGMLAMSLLRRQMPAHLNYFTPLGEFLRKHGVRALFPQVAPVGGVAGRAAQLGRQIRAWTDEPVNLIAHSMGGLDARYLISRLGMAGRVRSLTTIGTPHHGSFVADWFCATFNRVVPLLLILKTLGLDADGVHDCQAAACKAFNARTLDAPGVQYFSYGGAVPLARVSPLLRRPWGLLTPREGPNDGLVSVTSARWGEYLGTLDVDHFGQAPDDRFTHPGEEFDSLGFFCRLVEDLARRGF
jgi:triacylglycerol lipase